MVNHLTEFALHVTTEQIQEEAHLLSHDLDEVKEVMEAIITFCESVQHDSEFTKSGKVSTQEGVATNIDNLDAGNRSLDSTNQTPPMPACLDKAMSSGTVRERLKKNSSR